MVTRRRLRSFLSLLALYVGAALFVGYFAAHAVSGNRGLKAKQELDAQIADLVTEVDQQKADRQQWERRISLLRTDQIDPDMLEERARASLDYVDTNDLVILIQSDKPKN
jgi:cell division protein FtsB